MKNPQNVPLDKQIFMRYNPLKLNIYASFTTGWRVKASVTEP